MTTTFSHRIHQTDQVVTARRRVLEAARVNRPLMALGPSGSGKTTAMTGAVERAAEALGMRAVFTMASRRPSSVEFTRSLIESITGDECAQMTGARLDKVLIELLGAESMIVMVDEAMRLGGPVLDQLQYVWERQRTCFVLVAVPAFARHLDKSTTLTSRSDRMHFVRPTDDEIASVVAAMHPAFDNAAPNAILAFNQYAQSNLHIWLRASEKIEEWARSHNVKPILDHEMVVLLRRELG